MNRFDRQQRIAGWDQARLGDAAVTLTIRPWAAAADTWAVQTTLLRAIKARFDAEGNRIPGPPREVVVLRNPPADA